MVGIECLGICPACNRHVRCNERSCPFCGVALALFTRAPEYRLKTRLDRNATFSLGAAFAAVGILLGCDSTHSGALYGGAAPCRVPPCTVETSGGSVGSGGIDGSGGINILPSGGGAGAAGEAGRASDSGAAGAGGESSEGGAPGESGANADGGS
jgi:hypothetical protein